jgi:urease subunit alpha
MNQALTSSADGALDTVITNVVILDHWGTVRATSASAMAGSQAWPQRQPGHRRRRRPALIIGPGTDGSGEGKILTAWRLDSHVHFLSRPRSTRRWLPVDNPGRWRPGPSEGSKARR